MRIYQVYEGLLYGDGVSNIILSLEKLLNRCSYKNSIAVKYLDEKINRKDILIFNELQDITFNENDIIIYHMANGTQLNYEMEHLKYKKILFFHNITTPSLFRGINAELTKNCAYGVEDAKATVGKYIKAITLSEFSKEDLVAYGWDAEDVMSMPFISSDLVRYEVESSIIEKYFDDFTNFLFVGRISPNKKIEDIIKIFAYYQKNMCSTSRLFLVGKIQFENYYEALKEYVEYLNVDNVNFVNFVSNEELESYYKIADVFLCMSEHEGFCIPLIEAMSREIPVIAYSAAAVKDTMGNEGILVSTKDEKIVCKEIKRILEDEKYRRNIINGQIERARNFNIDNYEINFIELINQVNRMDDRKVSTEDCFSDILYNVNYKMESKTKSVINQEVLVESEDIIIYGLGKAGKRFYNSLSKEIKQKVAAFCDQKMTGDEFDNIIVRNIDECVQLYPDALFVVTPQKDFIDIIYTLIQNGLDKNQIVFYNLYCNLLVL